MGAPVRALYNPALLPRAAFGRAAVTRPALLDALLDALRRDRGVGAPQHHLLLGVRGSGKTFALRALGHIIEDDEALADTWWPLTFPEAQYDVGGLADLWTACLDHLAVGLQRRGLSAEAAELRGALGELARDDEASRAEEAFRLLMDESEALDRRFVLLIDNLDVVIDRLAGDQWRVRDMLSTEHRLVIIGASARAIESTYRYEAAFYDFFHVHELRPLAARVAVDALPVLGPPGTAAALAELSATRPGVLPALIALVGAQPRTLTLIAEGLVAGQRDVAGLLAGLLDRLTPGFRGVIERLAPQAQRIAHALATAWHPSRASELAARTRLAVNTVSAQLTRLVRDGLATQGPHRPGARLGYTLADRRFALWFLLRCGQPHRRRLLATSALLEHIYEPRAARPSAPTGPLGEAAAHVRADRWRQGRARALRALTDLPMVLDRGSWSGLMALLAAAAESERIGDARALLAEAAPDGRWTVLDRALELTESGREDALTRTAPELRDAVRRVAARLSRV